MLIVYDLDKTSLFCPIADFADRFIPKNRFLKRLYYKMYPFIHIFERKFGLLQINELMYQRARMFKERGAYQVVVTARHRSLSTDIHVKDVFKDIPVYTYCIAQGLTNKPKADLIELLQCDKNEEVIMFDDSMKELDETAKRIKRFTGIKVLFKDNKEVITNVY